MDDIYYFNWLRIYCLLLTSLLLYPFPQGQSFTHWFLDDGKIQFEPDSLYHLHTPGDLMLFIAQSNAANQLRLLERRSQELLRQQNLLRSVESVRLDKERQAFYSDPDCRITQKKLSQFDLYLSSFLRLETKNIRIEDFLNYEADLSPESWTLKPVCKTELLFSMSTYDHLKSVADRKALVNSSEVGLVNPIPQAKVLDEFGHRISIALSKNDTSWILLNFAAIYWRIAGHSYNAVECLRRALHYSPRQHKDLALVSLANILHRSKHSLDAAILMHAALESTTDHDIIYFTLGNIYGALGQFDLAEICYKYVAELQPNFEAARLRMHAARCELKLGSQLNEHEKLLQETLQGIEELSIKHRIFEDQQKELLMERSSALEKFNIYVAIQPPAYERSEQYND